MKTSQQWWDEVKADPELIIDWLRKQYRGEVTASHRIERFAEQFADGKALNMLKYIAEQERTHAEWILELLTNRGVVVYIQDIENAEARYWKETLPGITSLETGSAVAAHAEAMRLDRIRVIAYDKDTPTDIRSVFLMILVDEEFHERAFTWLSTPEAMIETQDQHNLGKEALGLEA